MFNVDCRSPRVMPGLAEARLNISRHDQSDGFCPSFLLFGSPWFDFCKVCKWVYSSRPYQRLLSKKTQKLLLSRRQSGGMDGEWPNYNLISARHKRCLQSLLTEQQRPTFEHCKRVISVIAQGSATSVVQPAGLACCPPVDFKWPARAIWVIHVENRQSLAWNLRISLQIQSQRLSKIV